MAALPELIYNLDTNLDYDNVFSIYENAVENFLKVFDKDSNLEGNFYLEDDKLKEMKLYIEANNIDFIAQQLMPLANDGHKQSMIFIIAYLFVSEISETNQQYLIFTLSSSKQNVSKFYSDIGNKLTYNYEQYYSHDCEYVVGTYEIVDLNRRKQIRDLQEEVARLKLELSLVPEYGNLYNNARQSFEQIVNKEQEEKKE